MSRDDQPRPGDEPSRSDEFRVDAGPVAGEALDVTPGPAVDREERRRRGARIEALTAACFGVAIAAAIALGVVYWEGGQAQAEGVLLAVATGGIGFGIVLWAKHFMPSEEVAEDRHPVASTEAEIAAFAADVTAAGTTLRRRRILVAMGGGALAALGGALVFPIRSLGPRPGAGLKHTGYAGGDIRVVREDGSPVRPDDLTPGGVITVWPEGDAGAADSSTLLIHIGEDQPFVPEQGREDWTVDRIVAYSKLCTHAGCPVGLYQADSGLLLCPCHQSTFDALEHARPVFGPAARPLPQLPLDTDDEGYISATGDFSGPVGPGFWDRGR